MCNKKGAFPMKKTIIFPLLGVSVLAALLMCACGNLASHAVAGQIGNTSSSNVKKTVASTPSGYTQKELNALLALKVDGYEQMTVSAFNTNIDKELFMAEGSEYILECYNKVLPQLATGQSENEFILTTLNLSITELAASVNNEDQYYLYHSFKNEVADGIDPYDGDISYSSYLVVPCEIYYRIDNAETLTVDTRDKAYIEYRDLLQQEIDNFPIADYASENLQQQFNDTFDRITKGINDKYSGIEFSFKIREVLHKP